MGEAWTVVIPLGAFTQAGFLVPHMPVRGAAISATTHAATLACYVDLLRVTVVGLYLALWLTGIVLDYLFCFQCFEIRVWRPWI